MAMARSADEQQLKSLMFENEMLAHENQLLRAYLERCAGAEELPAPDDEDRADSPSSPQRTGKGRGKGKRGDRAAFGAAALTETQTYGIAQEEIEARTKELAEVDAATQKEIADVNAMLGETRIRFAELKKEEFEFRRDVLGATAATVDASSVAVVAERWLKWSEDHLVAKRQLVKKIQAKNAMLKQQIGKLEATLKQKEEQGDSLHSIDFHQLRIENSQFTQKIKEKNGELLRLKLVTGKTIQLLNAAKQQLNEMVGTSKEHQRSIREREETLVRFTKELAAIEEELGGEKKRNDKMVAITSNAKMPQVLDYVSQKAELADLEGELKSWKRKVEIAEIALKNARAKGKLGQS